MGYYKSSWEDEGKTKSYALTQFEVSPENIYFTLSQTMNSPLPPAVLSPAGMNPSLKLLLALL